MKQQPKRVCPQCQHVYQPDDPRCHKCLAQSEVHSITMWAVRDFYSQERLNDKAKHLSIEDKESLKTKLEKTCLFYKSPDVVKSKEDSSKIWIGSEEGWDEDMIPLDEHVTLGLKPGEGPVEIVVTFRKKQS